MLLSFSRKEQKWKQPLLTHCSPKALPKAILPAGAVGRRKGRSKAPAHPIHSQLILHCPLTWPVRPNPELCTLAPAEAPLQLTTCQCGSGSEQSLSGKPSYLRIWTLHAATMVHRVLACTVPTHICLNDLTNLGLLPWKRL